MSTYRIACVTNVVVRGRQCGRFPLVLRVDGSAELDLMRYLVSSFGNGAAESTISLYASHLKDFYEQMACDGAHVSRVSLEYLNAYKSEIKSRASAPYAAQLLRTVLNYLLYLEQHGVIRGVIGEELGFNIQFRRTRSGRVTHPLLRGSASPKSNKCPSDAAIEAIKSSGPQDEHSRDRFELMVDWANVKGLRAKEVCALGVAQIPDELSIERALEGDREIEIRLTITKGGKPRNISVHPLLLARTRKYIEAVRPHFVRLAKVRARATGAVPEPSDCIFLSEVTGRALTPKALSNAVRRAFKQAVRNGLLTNEERVWLHGLRKRMVNRELSGRPASDDFRRETEVRQQTGHGTIDSMGRYVVKPA